MSVRPNSFGIRAKLQGAEGNKQLTEKDLIEIHHDFMMCYGWISLKDFAELKMKAMFNLNHFVQKEKHRHEQLRHAHLKFMGVKDKKIVE